MSKTGFSKSTFHSVLKHYQGPSWFEEIRKQAWDSCCAQSFPSQNDEEWRRTDIRAWDPESFIPAHLFENRKSSRNVDLEVTSDTTDYGGVLITVDGTPYSQKPEHPLTTEGVFFGTLDQALSDIPDRIQSYLSAQALKLNHDRFSAMHTAFLNGGTVLHVPKGVQLEVPLYDICALASEHIADCSHLLVILEEHASATLLHKVVSTNKTLPGMHIGAVDLILKEGSNLNYIELQNWGDEVWNFSRQQALLQNNATLHWTTACLGSCVSKANQEIALEGSGAVAEMNGIMFANNRQHLSYHTKQHHMAPHTQSDLLYAGALDDHSRSVWRGMIRVEPDAQKTNAYQRNDNLLLSEEARADSIPGLEIEADDVRCTHGATAGKIDADQIFYAMCRGMSETEANLMVIEGFFGRVYDRVTSPSIRHQLNQAVADKLGIESGNEHPSFISESTP